MMHDPTTTLLLKLPLSLKRALDTHSSLHPQSTSYFIRLGIARVLNLPDDAADMSTPTPPHQTTTRTRRQARRMQTQMATAIPQMLQEILQTQENN